MNYDNNDTTYMVYILLRRIVCSRSGDDDNLLSSCDNRFAVCCFSAVSTLKTIRPIPYTIY